MIRESVQIITARGDSNKILMNSKDEYFGDDLLVLTASGVANIFVFRSGAPGLLKLVPDSDGSADNIYLMDFLDEFLGISH